MRGLGRARPPLPRASLRSTTAFATATTSMDGLEVGKFDQFRDSWWSSRGPAAALHHMNPARVSWIKDNLHRDGLSSKDSLTELRMADVGAGGGILVECLARLGAQVTAIEPAEHSAEIARLHASQDPRLKGRVEICAQPAEELVAAGRSFDAVTCMEVLEHVRDPSAFLATLASLVRPGGALFVTTINRTTVSYLGAIVAAELVAGIVPNGTHDWLKFLQPDEVTRALQQAEPRMELRQKMGFRYNPLLKRWSLAPTDLRINYGLCFLKTAG